jgi:hypothetical protein
VHLSLLLHVYKQTSTGTFDLPLNLENELESITALSDGISWKNSDKSAVTKNLVARTAARQDSQKTEQQFNRTENSN